MILLVGPIQDATFGVVLIANAGIGIFQEVRAKRTLDRLAVLNAPRARVVRDGEAREVAVETGRARRPARAAHRRPGRRATASCARADGLEVDESLLTGESDPLTRTDGDEVLSGSFVVAGSGRFQATRVGADSYAAQARGGSPPLPADHAPS